MPDMYDVNYIRMCQQAIVLLHIHLLSELSSSLSLRFPDCKKKVMFFVKPPGELSKSPNKLRAFLSFRKTLSLIKTATSSQSIICLDFVKSLDL